MSTMSAIAAAAVQDEPAIPPYVVGALVLVVLLALLVGLLIFGRGRDHS